jgi:hypothetical protein
MIVGTGIDMVNMERIRRYDQSHRTVVPSTVSSRREITDVRIDSSLRMFCDPVRSQEAWLESHWMELLQWRSLEDIEFKATLGRPFCLFYGRAREGSQPPHQKVLSHPFHSVTARRGPCLLEGSDDESCNGRTNAKSGSKGH